MYPFDSPIHHNYGQGQSPEPSRSNHVLASRGLLCNCATHNCCWFLNWNFVCSMCDVCIICLWKCSHKGNKFVLCNTNDFSASHKIHKIWYSQQFLDVCCSSSKQSEYLFLFDTSSHVLCTGVACLSAVLVITWHKLHMFHAGGEDRVHSRKVSHHKVNPPFLPLMI